MFEIGQACIKFVFVVRCCTRENQVVVVGSILNAVHTCNSGQLWTVFRCLIFVMCRLILIHVDLSTFEDKDAVVDVLLNVVHTYITLEHV